MSPRPTAARDRLAVALDVSSTDEALQLADQVSRHVGVMKVGLQLFTASGPSVVRSLHERDLATFLDLKLHDIPATMAHAASAAASLGVRYLTVHAAAGPSALDAVARALEGTDTLALAVTTLTSIDEGELRALGIDKSPAELALRRARQAVDSGVRGFVCSALEASALRAEVGSEAVLITPGIRPPGASADDQRRVATPAEAVKLGADVLVVGRPIRSAEDPAAAAEQIHDAIAAVSS